ncbi:hypothetical protein [Rhizobium sp. BK418]|uniref:hypothetical protein n=1 Tax=Rhizobium sp. BK418 TaxID=2512120 RepID=UPI00104C5321|nr:hypothetical protein [Rhizobium sp. BK418]TCS04612.1 hypothetical protein EV281_103287 [Rhizobium sp. BK418]
MNAIGKVFEGEPRTDITVEGGRTTISVALRHLRPFDAQSADEMASVLAVAAVGIAGWISYEAMAVTAPAVGFFLSGLCGRPFMQQKIRHVAQVTATVKFTENVIWLKKIKKAPSWEPEPEWQKFDRSHEHRFVLYQHDKAQAEKDEIDHQSGQNPVCAYRATTGSPTTWFLNT